MMTKQHLFDVPTAEKAENVLRTLNHGALEFWRTMSIGHPELPLWTYQSGAPVSIKYRYGIYRLKVQPKRLPMWAGGANCINYSCALDEEENKKRDIPYGCPCLGFMSLGWMGKMEERSK